MQNEAERDRLFESVNSVSYSDIDLEGANVSSNMGLGEKWVIDRLLADFILLEYIDVSDGKFVDEDGFVVVKKESKQWRKAIVRAISPWSAKHFGLGYGDTVLLPDDKGLKIGVTQYADPEGNTHKIEHGTFVNGLKILGTIKEVK
jgi:hypothetical protein